ncbi:hypothetical protein BH23BAC3_BH23BAC3_30800 [soil metagenome]
MAGKGVNGATTTTPRGILKGRIGIEQRPKIVEERQRLGDIEIDLMMGKAHKSVLLVITDLATLLTHMSKVYQPPCRPNRVSHPRESGPYSQSIHQNRDRR